MTRYTWSLGSASWRHVTEVDDEPQQWEAEGVDVATGMDHDCSSEAGSC
jgi:hypothetical protein